jgi:FkbM family methyltransferase
VCPNGGPDVARDGNVSFGHVIEHAAATLREESRSYAALRALRGLTIGGRFGEPEYAALPAFVFKGASVIDIGANLGMYTWRLAALVGRSGAVVAIEPNPELADRLRQSARILRLSRVEVESVACGEVAGTASLTLPTNDGRPDIGQAHLGEQGIPVEVSTLDAIVARRGRSDAVRFVKIDAEGAEGQILRGATSTLRDHRPTMVVELQQMWAQRYGDSAQEIMDQLRSEYGYTACVIAGGTLSATTEVTEEHPNYVFIPPLR